MLIRPTSGNPSNAQVGRRKLLILREKSQSVQPSDTAHVCVCASASGRAGARGRAGVCMCVHNLPFPCFTLDVGQVFVLKEIFPSNTFVQPFVA